MVEKVSLRDAFAAIEEYWQPQTVAELHGAAVRVVKVKGEFVWHRHDSEDELFMTMRGCIVVRLRDRAIELQEGEMLVVPRGVEHRPEAGEEAEVLLIEPVETVRTGDAA